MLLMKGCQICVLFYPCFSCFGRQSVGIKLYICTVTLALLLLFSYLKGYHLNAQCSVLNSDYLIDIKTAFGLISVNSASFWRLDVASGY